VTASTPGRGQMPAGGWPVAPMDSLPSRRPVIGYVYELFTADPVQDSEHPYVGKTTQTVHQRVHGRGGHTSPAEVAKSPWKGRIRAGRAGYRILERVRDTGEGDAANDAALARAEAFWIDRIRPKYNGPRPVRPPQHEAGPGPAAKPARQPTLTEVRQLAAHRRARRRLISFAVLCTAFTWLALRLVLAMNLPWPAAPWIAGPAVGVFLGWIAFIWLDGAIAVLTGKRTPHRRRRRRYLR